MASSRKMMMIGILWLVIIAVLCISAMIGGIWWTGINTAILQYDVAPAVAPYLGNAFWIESAFYVLIVLLGIVVTYKIIQSTADESDYYPELGYQRRF